MTARLLAAWDSRDKTWMVPQRQARTDWLRAHGLPPEEMYRAEFYLLDAPFVRIFTYHRNEQGRYHCTDEHADGAPHAHEIAVNPPYDEPLWEFPPEQLL